MRRAQIAAVLPAVLLVALGCGTGQRALVPRCTATAPAGAAAFTLTPEQAANAATIAAVGRRSGLGSHAVTVALATALQESKLVNVGYGDRDSVGLFQQRPSQGWGSAASIMDPRSASAAFYRHLAKVPAWGALPVTQAAQAVQHSAAPEAYGQWEQPARSLARALTGEVPAGLSCLLAAPAAPASVAAVLQAASTDLGPSALRHDASSAATDWAEASWLVANAQQLSVRSVATRGHSWGVDGRWVSDPGAPAVGVAFR